MLHPEVLLADAAFARPDMVGQVLALLVRAGILLVGGALLIWLGIAQHQSWIYIVGVCLAALVLAAAVWFAWAARRGQSPVQWLLAVLVAVVVAAPAIVLPWRAYQDQLTENADWVISTSGFDQYVVDDRLYLRQLAGTLLVVDPDRGEVVTEIPLGTDEIASVGPDGIVYVHSGATVVAYDEAGEELWTRPGRVVAADAGTTLVSDCPDDGPCTLSAIDSATGDTRWSRPLMVADEIWFRQPELPAPEQLATSPFVLPAVAVVESPGAEGTYDVLDAGSGRSLQHLRADAIGVSGELVVGLTATPTGCVASGYRDGQDLWSTDPLAPDCPTTVGLLESRMYLRVGSNGETVTVDLEDGSWRECGQVELTVAEYDDETHTGVGSDDVIVYRDGPGQIYAVDADSGDTLWRHDVPGDRPAGLSLGHEAVTVLTPVDTDNPFVPESVAASGDQVTVLEANTGETTGTWVGSEIQDTTPVASGRAVLTADNQMWPVGR